MAEQSGPETPVTTTPPTKNYTGGLLRAAGLIAFVTVASKFLGFLRDWQIMHTYGASLLSDAYFAAFQIPSFAIILLGGLGGPFNTATVAVFSRLIKDGEVSSDLSRLLARVLITVTGLVFLLLSGAVYLFAKPIMSTILFGGSEALVENAAFQLKIMSPIIFVGGLVGIFYGIANVHQRFFWPSFSPAMVSVVMITALWLNPNDATGYVLAMATLAGCVAQLLVQLPNYLAEKYSLAPSLAYNNPDVKKELDKIGEILFPALVGTTIGQLTVYVDMFFTSFLAEGGWTAVVMGNRLLQLPIGVLQTALLVPIFPLFSRFVADQQWEDLRRYFKSGVVSLWFISIPILALMMLYTEPIIRLVFQHGQFDARATELVSLVLVFQAFSMLPYFARDSITRVFYAFHDAKTPLLVGLLAIVLKGFLDWLFVVPMQLGVGGIALSTTLITFFNMTLLGLLIRKHINHMGFREMVLPFAKLFTSGCIMYGIMVVVGDAIALPLSYVPLGIQWQEWLNMGLCTLVGLFIYSVTAYAFKVYDVKYLVKKVLGKLAEKLNITD